jgi:rhamnogalacturonyl hydrolase YesR
MSCTDTTRARTRQIRLARLVQHTFGLCLLSLPIACGPDKSSDISGAGAGSSGSAPISVGAGGSSAGAPSQSASGGGGGAVVQAGGASAGTTASGGTSASGAGGEAPVSGGGSNAGCAFQCADQCVEVGGTKKDGSCAGAQVCCDGATASPTNPLAHLVPSAKEIGLLLANRFSKQALSFNSVANLPGDGYKVACEWYGALGVAKFTNSLDLLNALVTKFNPLKASFTSAMTGGESHVDRYIFGMVPLEIYLQTGDESYLPLGIQTADKQQTTNQTRDAIDDMFMMTGLQLEAYRTKKDAKYIDFMANIMVNYLKAQQSNGLFFHNVTQAKVHWGRGNGWFAAGMAEMMRDLPKTASQYPTIEAGYKKMMEGLLKVQGKNGLWYQVLDKVDNASNWEESSGSAMFTYAMIAGVRRGTLEPAKYVPVIDAAWAGLKTKISTQGDVSSICVGTWYKASDQEYMALGKLTGDGHGQAPVLWAAAELLR